MNMIEAVKSVLSQYVGFNGRARRSEFWFWTLATILASIAVAILEAILGLGSDGSGPISGLLSLAIFLPGLAVTFRRLHDTGRSGWWIGGFYLGMLVVGVVVGVMAISMVSATGSETGLVAGLGMVGIIALVLGLVYGIALLIFLCQDSVSGPNKYGPNPKNDGNYDVFG